MIKEINKDNFNRAEILRYYSSGEAVCTLQQVDSIEQEDGSILEVVNKIDDNIVISGLTFTDEELAELNPSQESSKVI